MSKVLLYSTSVDSEAATAKALFGCWSGLGWNLVQVPLQSTPTPTHVD